MKQLDVDESPPASITNFILSRVMLPPQPLVQLTCWWGKYFLECSWYFSRVRPWVFYIVWKFQPSNYNTWGDMNFFSSLFRTDRQTDGQTESNAYEPTVHMHRWAQKIAWFAGLRNLQKMCLESINKMLQILAKHLSCWVQLFECYNSDRIWIICVIRPNAFHCIKLLHWWDIPILVFLTRVLPAKAHVWGAISGYVGGENKKKSKLSVFFLSDLIPAYRRTRQP